jgi:Fe2+ transport system protein FeoA
VKQCQNHTIKTSKFCILCTKEETQNLKNFRATTGEMCYTVLNFGFTRGKSLTVLRTEEAHAEKITYFTGRFSGQGAG